MDLQQWTASPSMKPSRPAKVTLAGLDINTATREELMLLRGVGAVTASRIIDARPFEFTDELVSRGVISEAVYRKLA